MLHIRKEVLRITQTQMAELARTSQATVSRWETGALEPTRDQLAMIRDEAKRRRLKWRDAFFFTPPHNSEAAA
ncbi:helix-turn-helix domain-containing protein [Labrys sp. La1]|uniref:helix-turn-helix domain-containing protein n=1 Tax=Labrys sp. La1 TaxID=3404917 RepID=UPI003EB8E389